jgi:hypothetical protein
MFLTLLKRTVKATLHDAVEEWALESGLPLAVVQEMRAQRLALAAQSEAMANAHAALALNIEEEEDLPALPMPSASPTTKTDEECPPPGDESALLRWVHCQREQQLAWADIAQLAAGAGHDLGEAALRMRYRRWREKNNLPSSDPPPAA